jgi:proton-translocating NAD(P)+ transhydrogenase subunit alpha
VVAVALDAASHRVSLRLACLPTPCKLRVPAIGPGTRRRKEGDVKIGVPRETAAGEARVALVPDAVKRLVAKGNQVVVEAGAGTAAGFADAEFQAAGAAIAADLPAIWGADLVAKVQGPAADELDLLQRGSVVVAMLEHLNRPSEMEALAARGVTALAMDWMPRSSKAQEMDARSSMSTVQGYKAVLLAADALPRFFPMLMTAAGTVAPAHVLVIGAGVAGLSAIATARRLGAVVEGFDVRPATREQVESLGARFLAMDASIEAAQDAQGYAREQSDEVLELERQTLAKRLPRLDVVITTALVPGKEPPRLLTQAMVSTMHAGAVIVDLAAIQGGNCEVTSPGRVVVHDGVTVIGVTDIESRVAYHASQMYARNVSNYLLYLAPDGTLKLDLEDELVAFPMITHEGKVVNRTLEGGA